jgi:cytochrome P450
MISSVWSAYSMLALYFTEFSNNAACLTNWMLLGIPEADQEAVRQSGDDLLRTEAGKPMTFSVEKNFAGGAYDEYIEWRTTHPSDDMMTELLYADFKDPTGTVRKLNRDEILAIVNLIAGACTWCPASSRTAGATAHAPPVMATWTPPGPAS